MMGENSFIHSVCVSKCEPLVGTDYGDEDEDSYGAGGIRL